MPTPAQASRPDSSTGRRRTSATDTVHQERVAIVEGTHPEFRAQDDLLGRMRALEQQNQFIKWLALGAIGLAFLL